ncbi:MAG TPA: hypothetical protein VG733_07005 [Chthoniobacteraceae bacterium]|nr:hypothetical protein [Chthoniobacteraceae bacterium]
MKTILFIGITALALGLAGCSSDRDSSSSYRSSNEPRSSGPVTEQTQRGTLLQDSTYDTGNRAGAQ